MDYTKTFAHARMLIERVQGEKSHGFTAAQLRQSADAAQKKFFSDKKSVERIFEEPLTGHALAALFTRWREDPPALATLVMVMAEKLQIDVQEQALVAALMAAFAADVPVRNAYHDNAHFREVTAIMGLYCQAHNKLAATGSALKLEGKDIAKCLLAACAHDLHHDGTGNTQDGVHKPYRLEDKAIAAIAPFMDLAGMSEKDKRDIEVMIRITDTSAPASGTSPHKLLRQLVKGQQAAKLPAELGALETDEKLRVMAAMMSDADLTPSAGLNYINMRKQSRRLAAETPGFVASDPNMARFLDHVVEKEFLSAAAKRISQPCLDDVYKKVTQRIERDTERVREASVRPPKRPGLK